MPLASPDTDSLQASRNPVFYVVTAFLHDNGTDCHLTRSLTFLKTALILRFLLKLGQSDFHALPWGIMLFFFSQKVNE